MGAVGVILIPKLRMQQLLFCIDARNLLSTSKDNLYGPGFEENRALIHAMFGENSSAISVLTRLLQTPYVSAFYGPISITPALLRLDPLWDPLRAAPAFQKLCEEKQP